VSGNVITYSDSVPDAYCFSVGQQYEDSNSNNNNKACFLISLSRSDLLVIEVLLSVTDWYSRDLGIDRMQYRFKHDSVGLHASDRRRGRLGCLHGEEEVNPVRCRGRELRR
jgi:hypothetical protein